MRLPNEEYDLLSDANEVYGSPTIPDEVRRLWESEVLARATELSDEVWSDMMVGSVILPDLDMDLDAEYYRSCEDHLGSDKNLEVALEECPFDFDELADNMIDSGPEF